MGTHQYDNTSHRFTKYPRRPWDESLNLWSNYKLDMAQYMQTIIPKSRLLANQAKFAEILPESE